MKSKKTAEAISMPTHQAFHLKRDSMEIKITPSASMTILSMPINPNCGPGMYIQNEISPSSLQITVPRNKAISISEPMPTHLGQPGPRLQPSSRFWPMRVSLGARDNQTIGCHWGSGNINDKSSKHFSFGVFLCDAKQMG